MHLEWIIPCAVIGFLLLGFAVSYIVVNYAFYSRLFKRIDDEKISASALQETYFDEYRDIIKDSAQRLDKLPYKRITITSRDGLVLSAKYFCRKKDKVIVFLHGAHSHPQYNFGVIGEEAYDRGYDLLIVDQRAHGQSEGKYITYGIKESGDLLCWIDALDENVKSIYLYGVSMGATTIAFASDKIKDERVKALVLDCGFSSMNRLMNFINHKEHLPRFLLAPSICAGAKYAGACPNRQTTECLKNTIIPTMFIHGEKDVVVPSVETKNNYEACASKKCLEIVDDAGHTCAIHAGGERVRERIFEFLGGENE